MKKHQQKSTDTSAYWVVGGVLLVIIGISVALVFANKKDTADSTLAGTSYPIQGRNHIAPGTQHDPYNSNPPTSGPHYAEPAPWGVTTEELPDETAIHNLEHGGVWISYKPGIKVEDLAALAQFANNKARVILTPRAKDDSYIALASWGQLLTLDHYDQAAIDDFYKHNFNKGPEDVPDTMKEK